MKKVIDFIKNNKIIRFIYNLIRAFVVIALAVYITFVLFQRLTGNAALFGYRVFTVASGSMTPAYNVNDVIYVKEVDPKSLKVGDDIAYEGERAGLEGLTVTHRIIGIEEQSDGKIRIYTQGINNENEDPSITGDQVLGRVCGKIPFINELNHIVKSTWGFFFLIFLPLTLVIILEVLETIVEVKIDNNKIRKYGSGDDDDDDEEYEYEEDYDESDDEESSDEVIEKVIEDNTLEEPSKVEEGEEEDEEVI